MKIIAYLGLIIVMCIGLSVDALPNSQETFLQANKLYAQSSYQKAVELYEQIDKKGPAVWYNMGCAYYELGEYAQAVLMWERAKKDATSDEFAMITQQIEQAQEKVGMSTVRTWYYYLQKQVSGRSLLLLQIMVLCAWVALWYLLMMIGRTARVLYSGSVLGCMLLLLSLSLYVKYTDVYTQRGVVHQQEAPVFAGPDKRYHVVHTLNKVDQVEIRDACDGWYKIQQGKIAGWIPDNAIGIV